MLTPGIANKIANDSEWQAVQQHIEETIASLDSIDDIDFTDKEKAAIEGQARVLAKKKLLEILEPFDSSDESTGDDKEHVGKKTGVL